MGKGKVYLVGSGPGDIQLMTVKGLKCIQQADVILYDRLVNPMLLEEAKADVELIYCGKLPHRHILRQESINELLVQKSLEGKTVVRLKGGDPSVFGRVGEEAAALVENQIEFEIVPGITAGIAASTYAGIPVTHRDFGASFAIVTGHDKSVEGKPTIDWSSLAKGIDTIAFYMGVGNITYISEQLITFGRDPNTPVILIQWGTYGRQQTLEGTLATIAKKVEHEGFKNPAITLVGNIVSLREKLTWFEKKPLFGRQVLLAKASGRKGEIAQAIMEQGGEVIEFPRFETKSLINESHTSVIIDKIGGYSQIYFTSPDSVYFFFEALALYHIDIRQIKASFFAGSVKSQRTLRKFGCFSKLQGEISSDKSLLLVGEKLSEKEMEPLLETSFDYFTTHENLMIEHSLITLQRLESEQSLNTIVLPSANSVIRLYDALEKLYENPLDFFQGKLTIAFGERSLKQAMKQGIKVDISLEEPSLEHLLSCLTNKELIG